MRINRENQREARVQLRACSATISARKLAYLLLVAIALIRIPAPFGVCFCFVPLARSVYTSTSTCSYRHGYLPILSSSPKTATFSTSENAATAILEVIADADAIQENQNDDLSAFELLAGNVARCLIKSDVKRMSGKDGGATGWTSWVDEGSAFRLQSCISKLILSLPDPLLQLQDPTDVPMLKQRDEALRWTKWMKTCPTPLAVELSIEMRQVVNATLSDITLKRIDTTRDAFLTRVGCRIILLPSGADLKTPIQTAAGAMAYGKLLYGGVTRYRLIGSNQRRAGERTLVYDPTCTSWLQYGGPDRNYQAVDMGPCALVEIIVMPKGLSFPLPSEEGDAMWLSQMGWSPNDIFQFYKEPMISDSVTTDGSIASDLSEKDSTDKGDQEVDKSGKDYIDVLESSFTSSVGGLQSQIEAIVRRVLDGRVVQPIKDLTESVPGEGGRHTIDANDKQRVQEAETLAALGLNPVRGLLLYGPPGCGKTVLAREISNKLDARPPKIVAAPELLDRWVGGSEKLVRDLFGDAEVELKRCGGDETKSALHVIVIDEIDAVFRKRSGGEDSGEATRASAVNQILAKLDGVNALGNVLLIGMTNRRELLDDALLRPGRLEVQVKIPLPDRAGRREILQIHFDALRRRGRLSQPLCEAIDGSLSNGEERDGKLNMSFLRRGRSQLSLSFGKQNMYDLAADQLTGGFSGADIAGLVRCAGSIALARAREQEDGGIENLLITVQDVVEALAEVKRSFLAIDTISFWE